MSCKLKVVVSLLRIVVHRFDLVDLIDLSDEYF